MLCWALVCAAAIVPAAAAERRPNLIAIVTDDQGQWALGCYGNRDIHTPTLDRLAADGAVFNNAYTVTPVCSPSRAAYMSGRWPTQVGITDFLSPAESGQEGIGLAAPIWPAALQAAGYKTAMIGKWHLGSQAQFHPRRKGFDLFYGYLGGGTQPMNPIFEVQGKDEKVDGPEPDVAVNAAIAFVREQQQGPFCVCLHFRAPHLPYGPVPAEDSAHYANVDPAIPQLPGLDQAKVKRGTLDYYASISSVDRALGRLFATLDELKLTEHTLVTFTSDHGYNEGRHYLDTKGNGQWIAGGVRGPKRPNMFETSIRVPLIARWPGVIRPGRKIDDRVSNIDTYRTMLGAMGVAVPAEAQPYGIDYSPLLKGEPLPPRDALYGQYDLHNGGLAYMRMIHTGRYKLVKHFRAKGMDELYDLQDDPDETRNLIGGRGEGRRALADDLAAKLLRWQQSIDDPVLRDSY